ncbi:ATP-binding cassette domain-containing protein [Cellulomonas sp. DKR-3]|uniref:ATP-binding cassette domain-containing protein n=1 Tax=Cellulomonas fulva TaxID=2835530 RepID=A0ABS5TZE8_9CELL|nr:ATP-binding cassette domain-containing protein [Cellulomonas fulva]MBT0994530.1 ATP-binding cassette domain-containing protein [Cellulomonas fulva]
MRRARGRGRTGGGVRTTSPLHAGPQDAGPLHAGPLHAGPLHAEVRVRRGGFTLAARVRVEPGRVVAVLGANGAGKSTLLATIAGTLRPDAGEVRAGGRLLTDATTHVPVEHRGIGLLGQDTAVFPHLTARENVAFGPRAAGVPARDARRDADAWLEAVGLGGSGQRRPDELSGGQRQRVALARALAAGPAALLLDEPFAQLDVRTAADLRALVRDRVRSTATPTVLVTHDVVDVLALADHVVVLHDGTVVEEGDPVAVLTDPVHAFTASLADLNLLTVSGPDAAGRLRAGLLELTAPAHWVENLPQGGTFSTRTLTFAPADVRVRAGGEGRAAGDGGGEGRGTGAGAGAGAGAGGGEGAGDGGGRDVSWSAVVVDVERGPRGLRVRTSGDVLVDLPAAAARDLDLRPGAPLHLAVPYPALRPRPT